MLSNVQLTCCLCRGTEFMCMDACVGLCSGLFFYILLSEAGKIMTGLLRQCRHVKTLSRERTLACIYHPVFVVDKCVIYQTRLFS